jgi:hypothetical protein
VDSPEDDFVAAQNLMNAITRRQKTDQGSGFMRIFWSDSIGLSRTQILLLRGCIETRAGTGFRDFVTG